MSRELRREPPSPLPGPADEPAGSSPAPTRRALVLTASLYLLMLVYAVSVTMLGPLLPVLRREFGLTLSQAGLLTTLQGVGGALSVLGGIVAADLVRRRTSTLATFAVYCASAFLAVLLPGYPVLLVAFFLIGASTRLLDSLVNAYVADLHLRHRGFYLSLLHASFGVGALLGPSLSVLVLHLQLRWSGVFASLGALGLCALLAFVAAERAFRREQPDEEAAPARPSTAAGAAGGPSRAPPGPFAALPLLRDGAALLPCLLALVYVGSATGFSVWIPSYVEQAFGRSAVQASLPVSAMWVGTISGRVTFSFLSRRFRAPTLLAAGNTLAAAAALSATLTNTYWSLTVGLLAVGFFVSATIPLGYSLLREAYPENGGAMASALTFFGTLGLVSIPWGAGFVADMAGFWYGILALGLGPCCLAVLSLRLALAHRRFPAGAAPAGRR
jgi:fucose permease